MPGVWGKLFFQESHAIIRLMKGIAFRKRNFRGFSPGIEILKPFFDCADPCRSIISGVGRCPLALKVRNKKPLKAALLVWAVCLLVLNAGYAMQPPPVPLNLSKFKDLISLADIIVVGKVSAVRQTEKVVDGETHRTVEADLSIEKLLKGKVPGENLTIQESYAVLNPSSPGAPSKDENKSKGRIVGRKAGPSTYHGHYSVGMRIVVLLEKAGGTYGYRPLGSGSYDRYLCEFLIEDDGIKPLYFRFAEDMSHYAESEDHFVHLINRLRNSDS